LLRPLYAACAAVVLHVALVCSAYAEEAAAAVQMRGFSVDFRLATKKQKQTVLASLEHQLEIVESVKLPAAVLDFFRTVPLVIDPAMQDKPTNGEYTQRDGAWAVRIKPISLPGERAIVLHELLHAYHHQVLKQPTPPVGRAYAQATQGKIYPASYRDAYFLSNGREYFAVVGEVYLFGTTERPPFKCSNVKNVQPEFIAYLAGLFGERECK
jgi:hypothetical protein